MNSDVAIYLEITGIAVLSVQTRLEAKTGTKHAGPDPYPTLL